MSLSRKHNVGSTIISKVSEMSSLTTSTDGSAIDGVYVDRDGYRSAKVLIPFKAVLGQAATLSVSAAVRSADSTTGANVQTEATYTNAVVATGGTGGTTERGQVEISVDLGPARRYVMVSITPTLSATSADTVVIGQTIVLGGSDFLPAGSSQAQTDSYGV